MKYSVLIAFGVLTSLSSHANAANKCYEKVPVPAHWQCTDSDSKSADFTEGCIWQPDSVKDVEVQCPPPQAMWVPGSPVLSQAQICSALAMKPAKINGDVCKSREKSDGGTYAEGRSGSSLFETSPGACRDNICDTISYRVLGRESSGLVYTCWDATGRRDYDPTDGVSHYACIEPE